MDSDSDERIKSLDINIHSLTPEEFKKSLDKMIVIYQNGYKNLEEYAYKKRHDIKSYLKWLYKIDPESFLTAFSKDKPIGFIAGCRFWQDKIFGEIGEIHELVVDKTFQRKGVGKKLSTTNRITPVEIKRDNLVSFLVSIYNYCVIASIIPFFFPEILIN